MDDVTHYMQAASYWKAQTLAATNRADSLQRQLDQLKIGLARLGWACVCEDCIATSQRHALLGMMASVIGQRLEFVRMRDELKAMLAEEFQLAADL